MYYHLIVVFENNKKKQAVFIKDQTDLDKIDEIAEKYNSNQVFYIDGYKIKYSIVNRFKVASTVERLSVIAQRERDRLSNSGFLYIFKDTDLLDDEKYAKDITDAVLNKIDNKKEINTKEENADDNFVFIVHGRNKNIRDEVELFLKKLELHPIILAEEPSGGNTIMEKIEEYVSRCSFGIIIYTPDDIGKFESDVNYHSRARQNVLLEHGYIMGKLGREKTCALVYGDVETPGDINGVVYVPYDKNGAWKIGLAKEMKKAKLNVDLNKFIS